MYITTFFNQFPDPRRAGGKRYPLPAFLWMAFLSIASGSAGYRAMNRFARCNDVFFQQHFGLRHGVPNHAGFRSLSQRLDKEALYAAFKQHFASHVQPGDWVAADGQSLCSTVCDAHTADQAFGSVIGLYYQRTSLTAALPDYADKTYAVIRKSHFMQCSAVLKRSISRYFTSATLRNTALLALRDTA